MTGEVPEQIVVSGKSGRLGSEEEQMTGEAPEQIVASGKGGKPWSEEVTLLRPGEYQSSKHPGDLGNLPRDSNNEDRLQARMEKIRIQKYLREKLPPLH